MCNAIYQFMQLGGYAIILFLVIAVALEVYRGFEIDDHRTWARILLIWWFLIAVFYGTPLVLGAITTVFFCI